MAEFLDPIGGEVFVLPNCFACGCEQVGDLRIEIPIRAFGRQPGVLSEICKSASAPSWASRAGPARWKAENRADHWSMAFRAVILLRIDLMIFGIGGCP